jgi:hypothetical protein
VIDAALTRAAGVVGDAFVRAVLAALDMSAERGGATGLDRRHDLHRHSRRSRTDLGHARRSARNLSVAFQYRTCRRPLFPARRKLQRKFQRLGSSAPSTPCLAKCYLECSRPGAKPRDPVSCTAGTIPVAKELPLSSSATWVSILWTLDPCASPATVNRSRCWSPSSRTREAAARNWHTGSRDLANEPSSAGPTKPAGSMDESFR